MHKMIFTIAVLFLIVSLTACNSQNAPGIDSDSDWLIPKNEVRDGGPGKDGIPALVNPQLIEGSEASYLNPSDLVLGVFTNREARAYPHPILDWHEIVNDDINGKKIAVTYCPLTGTGIGYNPIINNTATTFGVSGLLYNANLIPYDRLTNSNWSQMKLLSVNGPLIGTKVQTFQLIETRWDTWKKMFPSTKVVSTQTGYSRPYGNYPYGGYRTDDFLIFPVSHDDQRLPRKKRVHGILVGTRSRVYPIENFKDTTVLNDIVNGEAVLVLGSRISNLAVSYRRYLSDGTTLNFQASTVGNADIYPFDIMDNEGTRWNILGKAISGPRAGTQLIPTTSYNAYWFAWAAFWPDAQIWRP